MRFEWDERKAESNALKHGITFEEAVTIFADPRLLFTEDRTHSYGEEREWAIGEAEDGSILVVVFTIDLLHEWQNRMLKILEICIQN